MRLRNVVVTGASGYTGTALCRFLVSKGIDVVAFVRPTSEVAHLIQWGVQTLRVDIKNPKEVLDNLGRPDAIFHLAAAFRDEHSDRQEYYRVNVQATENLLNAAKAKGVGRFLHCSTVGVQGEIEQPPATEEYRLKPGDHYQRSKHEGELLAQEYFQHGLPGTIVRPVGIYGPGEKRFLKLFRAIQKRCFFMVGNGENLYHMTYIDDVVRGIMLAATKDEALGEVFTIAGPEYTTLRELTDMISGVLEVNRPKFNIPFAPVYAAAVICEKTCRFLRVNPPLFPRRVGFFRFNRAFSTEKARRLLGYDPSTYLHEGLAKTATWYRDHQLL